MRIIRLQLKPQVSLLLRQLAKTVRIADASFVEDLFAVYRLAGNGFPTQDRMTLIIEHYARETNTPVMLVKSVLNKRRAVLVGITRTALFQQGVNRKEDPLAVVERMLVVFSKLNRKLRQIQCHTCPFLSQCDYGQQYESKVRDIRSVVDPDYDKKVNQSCPHRPALDAVNDFHQGILKAIALADTQQQNALAVNSANPGNAPWPNHALPGTSTTSPSEVDAVAKAEQQAQAHEPEVDGSDEDEGDPETDFSGDYVPPSFGDIEAAPEGLFNVSFDGSVAQILDERFVDKLSQSDLLLFHIALQLDGMLGTEKKGIFAPSTAMSDKATETNIRSVAEEHKVLPSQHGLPEEIRESRLEKLQLAKPKHLVAVKKRPLFFLGIDVSSSMQEVSMLMNGITATKAALAATFGLAVLRKVRREGGIAFARFFNEGQSRLYEMRDDAGFQVFEAFLSHCAFQGGGTNIPACITRIALDIQAASDEMSRAEILLITDATDNIKFQVPTLRLALGKVPLNVLDVTPSTAHNLMNPARKSLEALADNYTQINPNALSLQAMVSLVGGAKKQTLKTP